MSSGPASTDSVQKFPTRRVLVGGLLVLPVAALGYSWLTFPKDTSPQGAYLRVVKSVNQGRPKDFFAYTEETAQHACYSIRDYRAEILKVAEQSFPQAELSKLKADYAQFAAAPDGSDVFALMVEQNGWLHQLRKDVSGIDHVEIQGERATVQTSQGTRYAMRRRPNGIWGLTAFTPALVHEAERAARDLDQVKKAAADYARVQKR